MRIITGTARGAKLATLEGEETRPTAERVKEAVFSAVQFDIHDRVVLDLFGGSGQMALEALSRGAERAEIVDISRDAAEIIRKNTEKCGFAEKCRVSAMDWRNYLRGASGRERFGLVFLDPPYKQGLLDEIIIKLIDSDVLTDDAIIIAESGKDGLPGYIPDFDEKQYRYGKTYITIYRRLSA